MKSATLLLMVSNLVSGLLGLVRVWFIGKIFGADIRTDAYNGAFELPDMLGYFLVGGIGSVTLVTMLTRFREAGDSEGEDRTINVVLNAMLVVLTAAIILAEFIAPLYTRHKFPKFDAESAALCTHLTRIVLPQPLLLFVGGVFGARLQVRKIFVYQAFTAIIYNIGIIAGAVLLNSSIGINSLPVGVLAGAFGWALINAIGAFRNGLRYQAVFNLKDPAFIEWLRLNLPLMLGVSLSMADKWIITYFASADHGGISRLTVAKSLFNAPLTVLGVAAGAASLPFFASLYAQKREYDFSNAVARSVTRLLAAGGLVGAWMVALAPWLLNLFRAGRFKQNDAAETAHYVAIFAITLGIWSAQGIYARAFYATGNARTPLVSGTIITLACLPVYWFLFHRFGISGLAFASNIGMFAYTVVLAVLLHYERLVSIAHLEWVELGRAVLASIASYVAVTFVMKKLPAMHGHKGDLAALTLGSIVWAVVGLGLLVATGSKLPQQVLRRRAA